MEVGEGGIFVVELVELMNRVNYFWFVVVGIEVVKLVWSRCLDVIVIGLIVDGSFFCFGFVYYFGKIVLYYFWFGVGLIVYYFSKNMICLWLYCFGVIVGKFVWVFVNCLNDKVYKIRENCVNFVLFVD